MVSILGTDRQGRDMFTRIVLGSQISLTIGLIGVALSLFLGSVLGWRLAISAARSTTSFSA